MRWAATLSLLQRLEVYIQSRELAAQRSPRSIGDAELRDHATRAPNSVFPVVSEGPPDTQPGVPRKHFTIAPSSLCEVAAAADLAAVTGVLPAAVIGELVGRMQRVAALSAG